MIAPRHETVMTMIGHAHIHDERKTSLKRITASYGYRASGTCPGLNLWEYLHTGDVFCFTLPSLLFGCLICWRWAHMVRMIYAS